MQEPKSGHGYWLYVPSNYTADRAWPLVITLHGTFGWDSSSDQVREWKALAEEKGLIVAAPDLKSVQGILPVIRSVWMKDIATDDEAILAVLEDVAGKYKVDRSHVILTGFSAGGYPMYYSGLKHPDLFEMLIARSCNSDVETMRDIPISLQARKLRIEIIWGRDDKLVPSQCWDAVKFFSDEHFTNVKWHKFSGGHTRRPEIAYRYWQPYLPKEYVPGP